MTNGSDSWDNLSVILEQAQQARADEDQLRAHTLYVRATQLDPNNATAWAGRAAMSLEVDDAIASWGYALAIAPQDQKACAALAQRVQERIAESEAGDAKDLIALGRDLAQAGQKIFAHQLLTRATELDAKNDEAWVWRAGSTDSLQEAIACLNHALALNPDNKKAQAGLRWGIEQQFALRSSPAVESSEQAAKQVAEGQRLLNLGDKSRAHEFFARATELDHRNESAWLWRGSTTMDVDEALMCVEQALLINPDNQAAKNARQWLRTRKLAGETPQRVPGSTVPVALLNSPIEALAPALRINVLLLATAIILLILLVFNLLRAARYIP